MLFDLDGVLIDSHEVWFHLLRAMAAELGYPEVTREAFEAGWGQGVAADARDFFPRHAVPEVERMYAERFLDHAAHLRVEPAARGVLDALRARGAGIAVITNTPRRIAQGILEAAGLVPDVLVGGTDVPEAKPAPDIVLRACDLLGTTPARALVVGDTVFDERAARAAGAAFAGMRMPGQWTLAKLEEVLLLPIGTAAPGTERKA